MRRAIHLLALAACAAALFAPSAARAQRKNVDVVNAIGLVDYGQPPDFEVGDWVRYHTTGASERGMVSDYVATAVITGEERFWGDDGFWIETWTEHAGRSPHAIASLLSYEAFGDSLIMLRLQTYMRKQVQEIDEQGVPQQIIMRRPASTLRTRTPFAEGVTWTTDTLGRDTVHTARGVFDCVRVRFGSSSGQLMDLGDSTIRNVVAEVRTVYMTDAVPITHIAREDVETTMTREAWRAGESEKRNARIVEQSRGSARIVDFGRGGLEPRLTPFQFRRALAEQLRAAGDPRPPSVKRAPRRR
jgi:hypothetical protein